MPKVSEVPGSPQSSTSTVNGSVVVPVDRITWAVPVNSACFAVPPPSVKTVAKAASNRRMVTPTLGQPVDSIFLSFLSNFDFGFTVGEPALGPPLSNREHSPQVRD